MKPSERLRRLRALDRCDGPVLRQQGRPLVHDPLAALTATLIAMCICIMLLATAALRWAPVDTATGPVARAHGEARR